MYSRGERGRRAAGSSLPGGGGASAGAATDPEWCAMGAESKVGPGGCSPRQSEGKGAPFPGRIKTPQPQDHCAQHRAAENRRRWLRTYPSSCIQPSRKHQQQKQQQHRRPAQPGADKPPVHPSPQASASSPTTIKPKRRSSSRLSSNLRTERARECVPRERVTGPEEADGHAWPRPLLFPYRHRSRLRPPHRHALQEAEGEESEELDQGASVSRLATTVAKGHCDHCIHHREQRWMSVSFTVRPPWAPWENLCIMIVIETFIFAIRFAFFTVCTCSDY